MFLYPLVKKKHAQLVPVYHQGPSLESCSLAFPNACDLPGLLKGLAAATPSTAPGSVSCLPSTQPSALARPPRDESPELSSFGEIPCLLYLDIPEAKGRAGQQSAGTEAWFRESLYVLSLSFTLCESTRLISHWISPSRRQLSTVILVLNLLHCFSSPDLGATATYRSCPQTHTLVTTCIPPRREGECLPVGALVFRVLATTVVHLLRCVRLFVAPWVAGTPCSSVLLDLLDFAQIHVQWACEAISPSVPAPSPPLALAI